MENEDIAGRLLDVQAALAGYQVALERANIAMEHAKQAQASAEKGIRAQQERILLLQDGPWPDEEDEGPGWENDLDGPSPSYIVHNSDPSIEWTRGDFE